MTPENEYEAKKAKVQQIARINAQTAFDQVGEYNGDIEAALDSYRTNMVDTLDEEGFKNDADWDSLLSVADRAFDAEVSKNQPTQTEPQQEAPKGKRGRPAVLTEEERKQKREASKPAQAAKARADRAVKRLEATINETAKPLESTEFDSDADRIAAKREAIKELMQLRADPNLRGTKVAERIKKALEHPSITQQERADIQKGLDVLKQRQDASSAKRAQAPVDNTFSKFTTAKQAIDHIIKTGNKVQRAFARRLKNFVKGVEFVVIEKGQELPPALAKHAAQWERSVGLFIENYDTGARAIFVRGESFGADQGINNVTVLHELFHAATNRKIALAEEAVVSGKIDTELVNAYKMLLRTMRNAQNAFAEASSEGSLSTDVADLYSSTEGLVIADPREFLAYGLTDEGMQDFLAATEGFAEEPSLFSNFVRSLRMFFGFPKSEHNALTNLISATDAILRSKAPRVAVSGEEASSSVIPPDEDQYGNPIRSAKKLARDQKVARQKVEASREGELLSATEQLAKSRSAEDVLSVLKGLLARNWQNMSHDAIDKLVRMPTMTFLADWSGINALKDADVQMQQMTGMANALTASAYEVRRMLAKDLNPFFRSAKKFREDFENLVYESTITRYDPSNPKNKVRNKALDTMWSNIGEKGRRMYKMLQKHYENLIDLYSDLLDQQIENLQGLNPEAKQNLMAMLRAKFESSARITPYFPLVRYGDYWLRVDKGDFKGFYMFESVGDRNAFRQQVADQMREDSSDEGIFESGDTVRSLRFGTQANSEMLKAVFDVIDNENFGEGGAEAKEALKDSIYQIYLQTMPEQKFRDMFIHRKDRIGFSTDVLRNVSASASKMSMQLARLKYAPMLRNSVSAAYDAVANNSNLSPFAEEAERRVNLALAGNAQEDLGDAVAGVANKASYFWFLSSAASALIQPASVYITALPVIGANHNDMLGAAKELGKMVTLLNQYSIIKKHPDGTTSIVAPSLTNSDSLNNREKSAVREMFQRGVTQSTYTGLVWGYKNLPTKSASTVLGKWQELGKEAGDLLVGALMHNTERLTREATFLASYRVGFKNYVKKGMSEAAAHEAAINQAVSDVNESLANYDLSNRPRWMQKGIGRVAFQFKMFPVHTTLLMTTNFFKMLPVLNKEGKAAAAKKFFGIYLTAGSIAGAAGLPAFSPIVAVLAAAFKKMQDDDEDELPDELKDIDPETWFRTVFLPDLLGDVSIGGVPLSEIVDTGPLNALTGLAISERIGLNDLFGRDTKEAKTTREGLVNWSLEKAGPTVSLGLSLADAYDAYQLGDFQKAAEKALPAFFKNLIIAERIASEGIKDSKGNEIVPPDKAKAYAIAQAVGFRSAELARINETNFKLTAAEQKIVNERDLLVGRMKVQARKGSEEGALRLEKIFETEVARFNQKNPEYAIDPDTLVDTLVKDLETRASARLGFAVTEKNARLVDPTLYRMEQRLERLRDKQ